MINIADQGHIGASVLSDPSATFDIVVHSILMDVLRRRFGVDGNAFSWVAEFLNNRRQVVYAGKTESDNISLQLGIPQGSVLGPHVFAQYAEDFADIFQRNEVRHHLFADDMQGHHSGQLGDVSAIVSRLESCIADMYVWCGRAPSVYSSVPRRRTKLTVVQFCITAASAAITEQYRPRQPVRRQASVCRPRPGCVVRRWTVNMLARFIYGADVFLSSALHTFRP